MTAAWTLPAQDIILDALQLNGLVGHGQSASPDDFAVCMTALRNIVSEMPLHGLSWPNITADPVGLAWDAAAPSRVDMPTDYFGSPVVSYVAGGADIKLEIITKAEYDAIRQPAQTAARPQRLYIAPNHAGYLWPVPTSNPELTMTYQAIAVNVDKLSMPEVSAKWTAGMGLWVAYETGPKFGVDMATRQDIERRFMMRRGLMLASAAETAPIRFEVDD